VNRSPAIYLSQLPYDPVVRLHVGGSLWSFVYICRQTIISESNAIWVMVSRMEDMAQVFSAAANPQRLSIMKLLADQKQVVFSEILKKLGLTSGNLGFHLKELMGSRLVEKKNGDSYVLTDLGLRLMVWTGKVNRRQERQLDMQESVGYMDIMNPMRRFRQSPGTNMEWLGGFLVFIGILTLVLGLDVAVIGVMLAAGCGTLAGGGVLNYLAGIKALNAYQAQRGSK